MGLLDKITFWKKEPEPSEKTLSSDLGPDLGLGKERDLGLGQEPQMPQQDFSQQPSFQQPQEPQMPQSFSQQQPSSVDKDIQLLSAKIDSLKAILDNISQRLANIERIAQESEESERYGRSY